VSHERSSVRNRCEWLALRGVLAALSWLPDAWLQPCMSGLSRVISTLSPSRRRRSVALVRTRLGVPEAEARQVIRASFQTLLLNAVDLTRIERHLRAGRPLSEIVEVQGAEHLRAALDARRGVIVCTAHIGAWEALGIVLFELFEPVWGVMRTIDNPLIEALVIERRGRWSLGGIPKDGGALKLARALRSGQAVVALLDQNAGSSGVILDFLGAPSSHHSTAGVFAARQRAAALPVYLLRTPDARRYRLIIEPPVLPDPALAGDAAVLDVTRRVSASLERQVRAEPGQWLWLHDRWRHAERVLRQAARAAAAGSAPEGRTVLAGAEGTNGG
jgi:KDO2-lipid IV(A) lauroyltransferase